MKRKRQSLVLLAALLLLSALLLSGCARSTEVRFGTAAVGVSFAIGVDPLIGMCTGSIPMVAGTCGFGMGATPNAMANTLIITFFINML